MCVGGNEYTKRKVYIRTPTERHTPWVFVVLQARSTEEEEEKELNSIVKPLSKD